jgi:5'-nucleotidase
LDSDPNWEERMRSTLRWLFPALLALSVTGCPSADKELSDGRRVVVLFTTDEHSHLLAVAPEVDDWPLPTTAGTGKLVSGVARRFAILKAQRDAAAARGADAITLSSGDFSQGTLASAAWIATSPELVAMKRMGYDAVSLGNHEFDLGPTALAAAIGAAASAGAIPPLVLTNVYFSSTSPADDALAGLYGAGNLIAPSRVITTASGLKIGIVASMGVAAGTVAGAAPPVTFWPSTATTNQQKLLSIVGAVQTAVTTLRQTQDVDAVILLGHGGIGAEGGSVGEDEVLAGYLTGVDLVVSGHSHRSTPTPRIMYAAGGKPVPVVQAKAYGREVGMVELVFPDDPAQPVRLDPAGTAFLPVDDRTLPTTDAAFITELVTRTIGYLEVGNPAVPSYASFLEETLSTITGTTITDNAAVPGDLYFYPLGQTDFDVIGNAPGETNAMNLDTDAMLAAAAKYVTIAPTYVAVQASGPIRGDLLVGETGVITFADLYRVVPLGGDPTVPNPATDPNAVPGFPLVRAIIPTAAVRAVFETLLQQSLLDGDFFVAPSGLLVHYDMTRPAYDKTKVCNLGAAGLCPGWVTYVGLPDGTPLYDVGNPALAAFDYFAVNPQTHALPVVTTLYIASFASAFGVPLLSDAGTPLPSPAAGIIRRTDGSAVKDHESLAEYVIAQCAANAANPGFLPSRYDASTPEGTVPRRMVNCAGGCP